MTSLWSIRIAASRLRPVNGPAVLRLAVVMAVFALFLWGDYLLFRRLFLATAGIEQATPFFALAILRNLLALVFLVATVILFSSSLTVAIGSFFMDLDLDLYHAAPRKKAKIVLWRWVKTLLQSALVVYAFLIPLVVAFAHQYERPPLFYVTTLVNLALLLTIPVSLASTVIVLLVRWFPVRRVHQIVATLAILVLTLTVVAFRMSRPERLFASINTDDLLTVLRAIELPSIDLYPGTALADQMTESGSTLFPERIWITALAAFLLFLAVAAPAYFTAFVRARESMAPVAIGGKSATWLLDRLLRHSSPALRAMVGKEIRTVTRDVAQWSQLFMMAALLFIYLYNIRMLPLGGDARAPLIAYANVGMAGFVIAAICLRFAYPSLSTEGKAFWLLQTAPVTYAQVLRVKTVVYATPLALVAILLTSFANLLLGASAVVWIFTLLASSIMAVTLASLAVAMGAWSPNFNLENPLQVGLSLGGFAYMAVSLAYVAAMMIIMARPVMRYFFWRFFGVEEGQAWISVAVPIGVALVGSLLLASIPLIIAQRRLARVGQSS